MKKFLTITFILVALVSVSNWFIIEANKKNNVPEKTLNNLNDEIVKYTVQDHLKPKDLTDISNEQIDDHWKLYKGYVDHVNKLNEELFKLRQENKGGTLDYSDRRRRYGFEYNGMVLHEYYFGNLTNEVQTIPSKKLLQAIEQSFGSYENWKKDFINTGKTRGIGWAILYMDTMNGNLVNVFVQDHEVGNIASFIPLLVMDVWEHAYMVDYFAGERGNYIDAFMKNINWNVVNQRYSKALNKEIFPRY